MAVGRWNEEERRENAERVLKDSRLPVVMSRNEKRVERDFWAKFKRFAGRIPFASDLVAAYYCAIDPATPVQVRGVLLAAIAYFILPTDLIPDFLLGLGFSDDATVIAAAIGLVANHIKPEHRHQARRVLCNEKATNPEKAEKAEN